MKTMKPILFLFVTAQLLISMIDTASGTIKNPVEDGQSNCSLNNSDYRVHIAAHHYHDQHEKKKKKYKTCIAGCYRRYVSNPNRLSRSNQFYKHCLQTCLRMDLLY